VTFFGVHAFESRLYIDMLNFVVSLLQEKELALKKSWQEVDSDIEPELLDYLAKEALTLARWRGTPDDLRSKRLSDLQQDYPGPGAWLKGWNAIFDKAAGKQLPLSGEWANFEAICAEIRTRGFINLGTRGSKGSGVVGQHVAAGKLGDGDIADWQVLPAPL
jgi:hypothetical protein